MVGIRWKRGAQRPEQAVGERINEFFVSIPITEDVRKQPRKLYTGLTSAPRKLVDLIIKNRISSQPQINLICWGRVKRVFVQGNHASDMMDFFSYMWIRGGCSQCGVDGNAKVHTMLKDEQCQEPLRKELKISPSSSLYPCTNTQGISSLNSAYSSDPHI